MIIIFIAYCFWYELLLPWWIELWYEHNASHTFFVSLFYFIHKYDNLKISLAVTSSSVLNRCVFVDLCVCTRFCLRKKSEIDSRQILSISKGNVSLDGVVKKFGTYDFFWLIDSIDGAIGVQKKNRSFQNCLVAPPTYKLISSGAT